MFLDEKDQRLESGQIFFFMLKSFHLNLPNSKIANILLFACLIDTTPIFLIINNFSHNYVF